MAESAPIFDLILSSLLCVALRVVKPPNLQPSNTHSAQERCQVFPKMASNKPVLRSAPQNYPSSVLRKCPSFRCERELRSAVKSASPSAAAMVLPNQSFDSYREASAFLLLIIALKSASPLAETVALPNLSSDLATEQSRRPAENVTRL